MCCVWVTVHDTRGKLELFRSFRLRVSRPLSCSRRLLHSCNIVGRNAVPKWKSSTAKSLLLPFEIKLSEEGCRDVSTGLANLTVWTHAVGVNSQISPLTLHVGRKESEGRFEAQLDKVHEGSCSEHWFRNRNGRGAITTGTLWEP